MLVWAYLVNCFTELTLCDIIKCPVSLQGVPKERDTLHFLEVFGSDTAPGTRIELQDTVGNSFAMLVINRDQHLVKLDFGHGPTNHIYTFLGCRHSGSTNQVDYADVILQGFILVYGYEGRILTSGSPIASIKVLA
jgi:hypothetical protein